MNKQRKTSHILNVFQYDETTGAVTLPSTLVLTAPASDDNSTKVGTTAWVRTYVSGLSYLTGNQSITVSGDATGSGTTAITLTLANTAVTPGVYGSATLVPVITVDSKGRVTSVTTAAISGSITFTGDVTGTGTTGTSTGLTLAASGVTAGTYTKVTVDTKGRVTVGASATTSDISEGTNLYYTDTRVGTYLTANSYATQSYVTTQVSNLVAAAPATLDTLNELAAALGNDPSFATTVSTSIGTKVPQARTLTINGTTYDLTANRSWTIVSMIYPGAGIAISTGTGWGTSITDNSANWNTAFGWGNHASGGYLTSATAATTYASLTGSYANPSWITSLAYSKITGVPAFLLSEVDTLATVTARGASTTTTLTLTRTDITNIYVSNAIYFGGGNNYLNWTNSRIYSNVGIESAGSMYSNGYQVVYNTGTWGINITGTAASETLSTVTGRGATTSSAVVINNTLTVNNSSHYDATQFSLDVNGGVLIKNTGKTAQLILQNANPAAGGNNGFVQHLVGGTTTGAFASIQTYYGASVAAGTLQLQPNGGSVTIGGYTVYHTGNTPTYNQNTTGTAASISGFNNPTTAATANTIVYRDGSGDIYGRYIFGSYHNSSDNVDTGTITYIMAKFGDNYHRSATAAKVQAFLGLGSLAYSSATIPTNNNQLTNGAGYITSSGSISGNAATATYATNTSRLYASDGTYVYGGAAPYYMSMTYDGTRWFLQVNPATPSAVRVSYADTAGSVSSIAWTSVTGRPTAVSSFTNDSGYITGVTNISGNAATATALSSGQSNWSGTGVLGNVVGMLAWKNYGNSHVIFDASAGTSPSGGAVNQTNATNAWTAAYPTLMGWNGSGTYGVRVDSARISDSTSGNAATATYATSAGSAPNAGNYNPSYGVTAGDGNGLKFWNGSDTYKISMGNAAEYHYGPVTDYSIKTVIDSVGATRGFTWGVNGGTPVAGLNVGNGNMQIAGTFTASNISGTNTGDQTNISGNAATASNANSISSAVGGSYYWQGIQYFETNNGGSSVNNSNSAKLQAYSSGNNSAFMSFHRGGYYAVNFGLDNDNYMRMGGWSSGANRFQLNMTSGDLTVSGFVRSNNNVYIDQNYGCTVTGTYASTRYQGIWNMGTSWYMPQDGTTPGNLYGLAWSHPNAGGQAGYLATHGLLVMENGITNTAISNGIWTRGDVTAYSDARVKDNVEVITNAIERIKAIRGVTFTRNDREDKTTRFAGVIAQEVLAVLPEVVTEDALGTYSVAYGNLAGLFIEAIKEQQKEIDELKSLINGFTK